MDKCAVRHLSNFLFIYKILLNFSLCQILSYLSIYMYIYIYIKQVRKSSAVTLNSGRETCLYTTQRPCGRCPCLVSHLLPFSGGRRMMIIYTLFVNCLQKFGVSFRISPFLLLLCKIKKLTHLFLHNPHYRQ